VEIYNSISFQFAYQAGRMNFPGHSLTLIVKGTFDLVPSGKAAPSEEQWYPTGDEFYPDDEERTGSPRYESDYAPYKPRADLLLVGKCHAPGGKPVPACQVRFGVGKRSRVLRVYGDRFWKRNLFGFRTITEPKPFREIELRFENGFGGEGFRKNPSGKGFRPRKSPGGSTLRPLPNIEDPASLIDSPRRRPDPAGFGPIGRMWEYRQSLSGSYGEDYEKKRWPWFPEDFDWGHFNAALPQMQVEGYLRGDERLTFENLHPRHPNYEASLPGLRVRCFANRRIDPKAPETRFEEVRMNLDTLWADMESEKLVLVWRGWTEVRSEDLEDLENVFILSEEVDRPTRSLEECHALFLQHLSREEGEWAEEDPEEEGEEGEEDTEEVSGGPGSAPEREGDPGEGAPGPKSPRPDPAAIGSQIAILLAQAGIDVENLPPGVREKIQGAQARVTREMSEGDVSATSEEEIGRVEARMRDSFSELGLDIDNLPPVSEKARAEQVRFARELGLGESVFGGDEGMSRLMAMMSAILPKVGMDPENLTPLIEEAKKRKQLPGPQEMGRKDEERKPEVPDAGVPSPLTREAVLERVGAGDSVSGENLTGIDLSGLDLTGADFSEAILGGAFLAKADLGDADLSNANLEGADLTEANLAGAVLAGADLSGARLERAILRDADLTEAILVEVVATGAVMSDAVFETAKMKDAIFEQVDAKDATFTGADLRGANFSGGILSGADFSGSNLDGACFRKADLAEANVEGARGRKADFREANLSGLRASEGCDFSGGCFAGSVAPDSVWEEASLAGSDLTFSRMEGADFTRAKLEGADLFGADMRNARFDRAVLKGAKLVRMNLFEGSLKKADLSGADLRGSNLYGAEFLDAVLEKTLLDGANLKMTKLKER